MTIERFTLTAECIITIVSIFYIPKEKIRLAFAAFSAFQAVTWLYDVILVQLKVVEYPVRIFVKSTSINFLPEFLVYPAVFAWFILLYPRKPGLLRRCAHYIFFISLPIWFIYFITKYTELERFTTGLTLWQFIRMYASFFTLFVLCRFYLKWFSKKTGIIEGVQ